MPITITNLILAFLFIWIAVLSFITYKLKKHYQKLVSSTKKYTIDQILDKLIDDDKEHEKVINKIKENIANIEKSSQHYFQKLGIIRFNPFERVGGNTSFVLALLNKENSGVVINFIYTREGVRVYSKQVHDGKGIEYDLSNEEKQAIKKSSEGIININPAI